MTCTAMRSLAAAVLFLVSGFAAAGTVYLEDGSVVKGEVKSLAKGELTVATDFAGELAIAADKIAGLATDTPMVLTLDNGDEVRGRLAYEPGGPQRLTGTEFGPTTLETSDLRGVRPLGAPSPAEAELAEMRERRNNLWSGQLLLGLSGTSGNSSSRNINIGAKARREAEDDRLYMNFLVNKARQDGVRSTDETIGSVRLERDFSERLFGFVQTEAERDEFENVEFRSTTTIGPGYFFIMEEDQTLKGRLGLGYEYSQPETDDDSVSEAVLTFGYDYMVAFRDWFEFTHELTVLPQVANDPGENFRVDSILGAEAPLGDSALWSVLAQYRHDYNNNPESGVEELDTTYMLNLVRDFE